MVHPFAILEIRDTRCANFKSQQKNILKIAKSKFSLEKFAKKCGELAHVVFINSSRTQLHEIHGNQVINAYAISMGTSKILGSVPQRKLIRGCCSERYFSRYVSLPKISVQPQLRFFASPIDIEKLIKAEGQFLAKLRRVAIQDPKGCCTFQMSLVYNRVCWGFV